MYNKETLAISGFSRQEHENFENPEIIFERFLNGLMKILFKNPTLISDNNGYDASWINYYFHFFLVVIHLAGHLGG